jgi:WS/DGAT/MGAT family acyltransferase
MAEGDIHYQDRMSDADKLMWTIEHNPMLRSTITSVVLLDKAPDRAALAEIIDRASRTVPRLRQRVVSNPLSVAPPRWEIDPNFDLHFHLRWVRAGGDGSLRNLFEIAEPIAMQGFDRARPLWEYTVVEGLEDGKAGLIMKIHHAITDGVGGVALMLATFDLERDPGDRGPLPDAPPVHVMNQRERFLDAMAHESRRGAGIAKRSLGTVVGALGLAAADPIGSSGVVAETAQSVARMLQPAVDPLSPIMRKRSLSVHFDTITIPLDEAKRAAKAAEGKLNDAFLGGLLGGWRRYHDRHGLSTDALRMSMPISVRSEDTANEAGNQFAPARFAVPLGITDPVERMATIHRLVEDARTEPALALLDPMAGLLNRFPKEVATGLFGAIMKGIDFTASNVPGAPIPLYLAGAEFLGQFAFGPMAGAACNVTLLSYRDDLNIGFNTDPAAVADPDTLMACMREGFDEILALA